MQETFFERRERLKEAIVNFFWSGSPFARAYFEKVRGEIEPSITKEELGEVITELIREKRLKVEYENQQWVIARDLTNP